ncbi:MAG: hypothetical protein NT062_05075 [Proteobacteria bacterium]|nr:hypothetical protein [Pseudomonadota bacterium]
MLAFALCGSAHAAPVGRVVGKVAVTEPDGKPAVGADVIVYVVGYDEPASGSSSPQITQVGRAFVPDLLAITVGERVRFPNGDAVFHNVFSQSKARKFDLGSFRKGESKDKEFPTSGVVDVYCNIHPEMAATILVLPNRRFARARPDGSFAIEGVRPGTWKVFAYTRRATRPTVGTVTVTAGADATLDLALVRGAAAAHANKFGEAYRAGYR